MTRKIAEQVATSAKDNWPILLLVAAMSGGSTGIANMLGTSSPQETTQQVDDIRRTLQTLSGQIVNLEYTIKAGTVDRWTSTMEAQAWKEAGDEIRRHQADWKGPDVHSIKKTVGIPL